MDIERLITDRARGIDASGIRRVFDLASSLKSPINLSIGQPDFPVPQPIKDAALRAIQENRNGYTPTQGLPQVLARLAEFICTDVGWDAAPIGRTGADQAAVMITSGTSGALALAFLALIGPGDEAIIPDPYFVAYPHMATLCAGRAVRCDTYPDLRMTAERVEPLITERTKLVLYNSPSNPAGVVGATDECRDLLDLCRRRGVLLISDEIYDEFTYPECATESVPGRPGVTRCPSPARAAGSSEDVLLVRGFGKSYGVTGWRLGYAAGPRALLEQMAKIQQYTFVCAPSALQASIEAALEADMSPQVLEYRRRRDYVVQRLSGVTQVATPGGAFYAFPKVPERLGLTGTAFVERCIERELLVIPGGVFSGRDTHVRLSYATSMDQLERGMDVLVELMGG